MNQPSSLLKITTSPLFFIAMLVSIVITFAFGLAFIFMGKVIFSACFLLLFSILTTLSIVLHRNYRNMQSNEFGNIIFDNIIKKGIKDLDIDSLQAEYNIPHGNITASTHKAYTQILLLAMKDFKISEKERKLLDIIAAKLGINKQESEKLEKELAKNTYRKELHNAIGDGRLTENESSYLLKIRSHLGLTVREAYEGSQNEIIDGYKRLFTRFANNGIVSPDECEELLVYSKTTGLDPAHATQLAPGETENLYRRTIAMICQDGAITDNELLILDRLEELLKIPDTTIKKYRSIVKKTQELEKIRKGQLPVIHNHNMQLNPSELCHWDNSCKYAYRTPTQQKDASGRLIVTDRRLLFVSDVRNFELNLRRIINLTKYSNGIEVGCTSNRGCGFYMVSDPDKLDAILDALTKRINFVVSENSDSARTRHIPDDIKVSVWQRDGGKCVKCGAFDYLEYDHIIPFSKGGANSLNNVQLLCRRCNLSKGAELV